MKNKIRILFFVVLLISISFISASSIYNWRYQGASNEPSTSYYSGSWNSNSKSSSGSLSNGYVPISQKLKTFNGPYTEIHIQNTAPYPRPISTPVAESNNFQGGNGYDSYVGYSNGYGSYGYSSGYYGYGYNYYSPTYYGYSSYDYYSDYYPGYYWY